MSDNVTPIRPDHKKGVSTRRKVIWIAALACVLVLVLAIVVVAVQNDLTDFGAVRRYFRYRNSADDSSFGVYSYDAHNANRFAAYEEGLAVATVGGLQLLDDYTGDIYNYHENFNNPAVLSEGNFVLSYDVNGTDLVLAHATRGELLSLNTKDGILDADLSGNGAVCYITSESNYKAVIPVYNAKQEQVYVWYSASAFVNQCAVSADADMLAAVSMGQENAAFQSNLMILKTDSTEVSATLNLGDTLVYELAFLSDSALCVWGETGLIFASTSGDERGRYDPDTQISKACLTGDDFALLWLQSDLAGEEGRIVTVGTNGAEKGSCSVSARVLDVSACGGYVSVLTAEGLRIYNEKMELYAEHNEIYGASRVLQRADGSVILAASGNAVLYIP